MRAMNLESLLANKKMRDERVKICKGCEHLSTIGMCGICGCVVKLKAKLTASKCPIGKWEQKDES